MAVAHYTFGHWPIGYWPPWHWSGQGGYLLYRGESTLVDDVDFDEPVGGANAGQETVYHRTAGLAANTDYTYALRAVSDAGELEEGVAAVCRVRWTGAALVGQRPNGIVSADRSAIAGGLVRVEFLYSRLGEGATAASVQIARVVDGVADWANALATVTLRSGPLTRHSEDLATEFGDGATVRLALRAVTAAGVGGPEWRLHPIASDDAGPAVLDSVTGVQA